MKTSETKSKTELEIISNAENHKIKIIHFEVDENNHEKTLKIIKVIKTNKMDEISFYPPSEDIYNQAKEETDINPEDISKNKAPNEEIDTLNEKKFEDDMSGDDLDVPGSELDDQQESIGNEDEENNYYSLGGDNHNNLDEDNN